MCVFIVEGSMLGRGRGVVGKGGGWEGGGGGGTGGIEWGDGMETGVEVVVTENHAGGRYVKILRLMFAH